jgi:subtilase family serine protease
MRAVPDVSLSAAGHDGYMTVENGSYVIVSGTSVAAPSFAGIMALVVEGQGGKGQGSANPELYALVRADRDPFHATPSGNNSVPGVAGFTASGADFNLATGLGSVDGAVLAGSWGPVEPPTLTLTAASSSVTVASGGSAAVSFTASTGGQFAGSVSFSISGLPAGITAAWSANPLIPASSASANPVTLTLTAATGAFAGSSSIVVTAWGDGLTSVQSVTVEVQARPGCSRSLLLRARCGLPSPPPVHGQILPRF